MEGLRVLGAALVCLVVMGVIMVLLMRRGRDGPPS